MGFEEEALAAHNKYRAQHGAPKMTLNRDLCNVAQKWAEWNARSGTMQHSSNRRHKGQPVGENLAGGWGTDMSGEAATKMWYDEIKDYNFHRQGFSMGTGHFTQVVWKDSVELGIGRAQGSNGNIIVCANYFPAGNFAGAFERNVFPQGTPLDDDQDEDENTKEKFKEMAIKDTDADTETGEMGFEEEALAAHNKYRAQHGAPKMTLNRDICKIAQKWAEWNARSGTMQHSSNQRHKGQPLGENLAGGWGMDMSGQAATKMWYDEIKDYNFHRQGFSMGTGHFTQVVWKGSVELGIGRAQGSGGNIIVCANYFPAGNMMGDFERNVFPKGTALAEDQESSRSDRKPQGMEVKRCPMMEPAGGCGGGGSVSKSTRTERVTEDRGDGLKTYTKTIVTETRIDGSGKKTVSTTETESVEAAGGCW